MSTETVYHESSVDIFLDRQLQPGFVKLLYKIGANLRARICSVEPASRLPEPESNNAIADAGLFSQNLASSGPYCALLLKKYK